MTRATLPNLGSLGVLRDPPAHEIDPSALSDGLNLRMRDGCAERIVGEAQVFTTPAVTPYWVGLYATPLARYVVHAGTAAVYADDGATRANITGSALNGVVDNRFSGGVLGGVLVLNNGVDKPRYWGGSGSLADLPDMTSAEHRTRVLGWALQPGDLVAFHMLTLHASAGSASRRRVFSARYLGDDMVLAPRAWRTSPEFPGLREQLAAGAPMDHPLFPLVYPLAA